MERSSTSGHLDTDQALVTDLDYLFSDYQIYFFNSQRNKFVLHIGKIDLDAPLPPLLNLPSNFPPRWGKSKSTLNNFAHWVEWNPNNQLQKIGSRYIVTTNAARVSCFGYTAHDILGERNIAGCWVYVTFRNKYYLGRGRLVNIGIRSRAVDFKNIAKGTTDPGVDCFDQ